MNKKATTSKTTKKTATRTPPLPLGLMMLAKSIHELDMPELRRAMAVARRAIQEEDSADCLLRYIEEYAERGPYRAGVRQALAADLDRFGDVQNAYSRPALMAGMSIAWLMLRGEGGVR